MCGRAAKRGEVARFFMMQIKSRKGAIGDSAGVRAIQIGIDIRLAGNWYLNADLKHLWLNNKVKVNGFIKAQVTEDPWIAGVGFGYKF